MGKKAPKAPPPPDPKVTAAAQSQANKEAIVESARVNAVDITGPFGTTRYRRNADGTPAEQITTLDPESQYILDQQSKIGMQLADTAFNRTQGLVQTPFTMAGLPYDPTNVNTSNMPSYQRTVGGVEQFSDPTSGRPNVRMPTSGLGFGVNNLPTSLQADLIEGRYSSDLPYDPRTTSVQRYAQDAGDAAYNQMARRLDQRFSRQDELFEQRMADRGIPLTGEAYTQARREFDTNANDAYLQAADRAREVAGSEAQRFLGMEQGLRKTAFDEDQTNRGAYMRDLGQFFTQGMQSFGADQSRDQQDFSQALQTNQQRNLNQTTAYDQSRQDQATEQQDWLTRLQTEQNIRGQALNERLTERNQGINEISAILQGSPAMGMPQAPNIPTYRMNPVDVAGITNSAYNAQMQNYQAQQANRAAGWNGAMGIASAVMPLFGKSHPSFKVVHEYA